MFFCLLPPLTHLLTSLPFYALHYTSLFNHIERMPMPQIHDSVIAAKYLLALADKEGMGRKLNVTKVQKMLYIAYGAILAKYNYAFINEQPHAWPYGPVFPRAKDNVDLGISYKIDDPEFAAIRNDTNVTETLTSVVKDFIDFTAAQLSSWSHSPDGPWDKTRRHQGFKWNEIIPDSYISEYFSHQDV